MKSNPLQKKILPFLVEFFPRIQFIVSTHSPFVLSSISNCIVCDLETKSIIKDLSNYSYDALLETYFEIDKYSSIIKEKIFEFDKLSKKLDLTIQEKVKLKDLRNYFAHMPASIGIELLTKIQEIELRFIKPKNK